MRHGEQPATRHQTTCQHDGSGLEARHNPSTREARGTGQQRDHKHDRARQPNRQM
jgi:hypothetical protein